MTQPSILTELAEDKAWVITIDNPEAGGTLSLAMTQDLARACQDVPPEAKFVLLQSNGSDFCIGRQSPMPPADSRITAADIRAKVSHPVLQFYATLRSLDLPVISAVQGKALGVGCAVAGLADVILAHEDAIFQIPEMNRDIPPLLVMTALSERLSRASLARLVLSRAEIGATEAVQIGLASQVVAASDWESEVAAWRAGFADNSRTSLSTIKRFLNSAPELGFGPLCDYAATANAAAMSERYLPK